MTPLPRRSLGIAAKIPGEYCERMDEPKPNKADRLRTRVFLVVFFGLALLLSITTIVGTWNTERENAEDRAVTTTSTPQQ
jgi:hypothetical protein